jgi:hypothetical protein
MRESVPVGVYLQAARDGDLHRHAWRRASSDKTSAHGVLDVHRL